MKMRIQAQDNPLYPYRDKESHAALTLMSLKRHVSSELEYLLTHMRVSAHELSIVIEVVPKQEKEE